MSAIATLKIWRGDDPAAGRFDVFAVPFEPGQSVLDALRFIRAHRDPTLAIRFSCINANACKECMIALDGRTVYACTARLEPREMTLAPLSNKRLVRDLVTEIAPPAERLADAKPPGTTFNATIGVVSAIALAWLSSVDAAGAADTLSGCYKRVYAPSHLAAHAGQSVTSLTLRVQPISETGKRIGGHSHSAFLSATFRAGKERGFADSDCAASGESLACAIDFDRGRFRLTKSAAGLLLEIESDLRIHKAAEGPLLTVINLGNPEDRKFLLSPAPDETCSRDLEQLEPS